MQCKKFVLIWTILFMFMTMAAVFADDAYYNKSYAIVVGISKYASLRWKDLPYARSDAAIIADILRHKGFEVLTLYDRNATRHAILARLEKNIAPRLSPDDRVLFYFSGHGYTKQKGDWLETFLIPYDKENIDLNDSMIYISMSDLARQSKLMAAAKHQLFIIDAPITVVDQSGAENIILTTPDYITQITQRNACQLLSAGKHKKTFTESKGPVYNILSKLFAEALDKGQADINGDGLITCLEMWGYISPRATNLEQKPDYGTFSGHDMGEFVFYSPESIRKKIAEDKELEIEDLTVEKKAPPIVDIQPGRLYIETVPQNARIRILNIVPPYRKGMMLSPGNYKIEVSKPGYQTKIQWITIANQDRIHETIELVSSRPYSQLYVNPEPSGARIRIMNIVPPYSHGMALQAGKYLIEVSMPGYKSVNQWITIAKGKDCIIEPVLQPSTPQFQAKSPQESIPQIQPKTHKPSSPKMDSHRLTEVPIKVAKKKTKTDKKQSVATTKLPLTTTPIAQPEKILKPQPEPEKQKPPERQKSEKKVTQKETTATPKPKTETKTETKPETQHQKPTTQKQWRESVTGMVFIKVKGDCYEMGCGDWTGQCDSDELPVHKVCVDDFWMGQYEVTQNEWQIIMGQNPSLSAYGSHYPVEKVSWNDVQIFINKLNKVSNHQFRLPTEAEWEYACRSGGKPQKYSGKGLDINHLGWFKGNSMLITHGVGNKAPNFLDLYDMSGNVSEWCMDAYDKKAYSKHSKKNPLIKHGATKVVRGGDWSDEYSCLRCSSRRGYASDLKSKDLGFRLIRER